MTGRPSLDRPNVVAAPRCRGCSEPVADTFVDLGMSPLANSYVPLERAGMMEAFYPLKVLVCRVCLLVQLEELASAESIFEDYAYFSSWSTSWLEHARSYARDTARRLGLGSTSRVVELASNDGYLLRWFVELGVPVLGVEPAANVAQAALDLGVPTEVAFFGTEVAGRLATDGRADLIVANNVLAHVPDLHDFLGGLAALMKPDGCASIEFPHLLHLVADVQYDTIYHEHFSYFSLLALLPAVERHGLVAVDVEELATHGGSLRLWLRHAQTASADNSSERLMATLAAERDAGLHDLATYRAFGHRVAEAKRQVLQSLIGFKGTGLHIAGYGAPAKANTLLNHCGIGTDFVDFTVDANPAKQGTLLPGSRIPVLAPSALREARPDIVWLLPWNLRDELIEQLSFVREWGGRFFVVQPEPLLS